jgi:diguanylate cyclase (GGDEF)-like protein
MRPAPTPKDESARIATLHLLRILDTQPEERFDRLTRMARRLFGVPIATVTLIDTDRQWFKSKAGFCLSQTPRNVSFCGHAILGDGVMAVPDARQDDRFHDNPLVTGDLNIRFYAGCPLKVGDHNVGTLCLIDDKPRTFDRDEQLLLQDLAQIAEQELSAVQLATTDHLTAISNRRGFELLAAHTLQMCRRLERPATLLLFDLNRFKEINDRFGHAAGDCALQVFAQGLLLVFRESDVIGRLGGDEFAVLLTGASPEAVAQTITRLDEWIRQQCSAAALPFHLGFSVGAAEFQPENAQAFEDLLARTDTAMYEHKQACRG